MGRFRSLNESLCTLISRFLMRSPCAAGGRRAGTGGGEGGAAGMQTPPPPSALLGLDEAFLLLAHWLHLCVGWVARAPAKLHGWPPAWASLQRVGRRGNVWGQRSGLRFIYDLRRDYMTFTLRHLIYALYSALKIPTMEQKSSVHGRYTTQISHFCTKKKQCSCLCLKA